jgi:pimeloyl-ACP methyl ester carboxylesterase
VGVDNETRPWVDGPSRVAAATNGSKLPRVLHDGLDRAPVGAEAQLTRSDAQPPGTLAGHDDDNTLATMTEMTLTSTDGTKLAVRCTGHGSPIVLVHGALGDVDTFALIEGLLAERHSVWVYSRRGRGGSGDGPDYTYHREVEDVRAVLTAVGDRAHMFGHSGGAVYALLAAESSSLRSLVLYELPLIDRLDASFIDGLIDQMETAIDAGDPDRALELFWPIAGIEGEEVQALRALEPVWARMRDGVRLVPREMRSARRDGHDWLVGFDPPDVPTLYLYGQETDAGMFPSPRDVLDLLPDAQLRGLPGQRHLGFAFDPASFAHAILEFTATHNT